MTIHPIPPSPNYFSPADEKALAALEEKKRRHDQEVVIAGQLQTNGVTTYAIRMHIQNQLLYRFDGSILEVRKEPLGRKYSYGSNPDDRRLPFTPTTWNQNSKHDYSHVVDVPDNPYIHRVYISKPEFWKPLKGGRRAVPVLGYLEIPDDEPYRGVVYMPDGVLPRRTQNACAHGTVQLEKGETIEQRIPRLKDFGLAERNLMIVELTRQYGINLRDHYVALGHEMVPDSVVTLWVEASQHLFDEKNRWKRSVDSIRQTYAALYGMSGLPVPDQLK